MLATSISREHWLEAHLNKKFNHSKYISLYKLRSLTPLTDLSYQTQKKNALHPIQFIGEHSL